MLKNVAINVDKETQPPLWTALALPFRSYRADQLSSAVVRGRGDCPFSAVKALRSALEGLITQAQEIIDEIDAELRSGTITAGKDIETSEEK